MVSFIMDPALLSKTTKPGNIPFPNIRVNIVETLFTPLFQNKNFLAPYAVHNGIKCQDDYNKHTSDIYHLYLDMLTLTGIKATGTNHVERKLLLDTEREIHVEGV